MLTTSQYDTVAFSLNGDIICPDCAVKATSAITVARAERGMSHGGGDLSPISRYELDEYVSEHAWEYASQEHEEGTPEFEKAYEARVESEPCGSCGRELTPDRRTATRETSERWYAFKSHPLRG